MFFLFFSVYISFVELRRPGFEPGPPRRARHILDHYTTAALSFEISIIGPGKIRTCDYRLVRAGSFIDIVSLDKKLATRPRAREYFFVI